MATQVSSGGSMVPVKPSTPLGLPPWCLVAYYTWVLATTGLAVVAMEPLKMMMRDAGIMAGDGQEAALVELTTAGITASMLGAVTAGLMCDFTGPKVTAISAGVMFILGYSLIFLGPPMNYALIYCGFVVLGAAYPPIFLSRTSVASLYPNSVTIVLSILGSGPDMSLGMPKILHNISTRVGVKTVISFYMCYAACIIVSDAFLVPWSQFESPKSPIKDEDRGRAAEIENGDVAYPRAKEVWGFEGMSLKAQLMTSHFWMFAVFTFVNVLRKTHYTQLFRPIYEEIAAANNRDADPLVEFFMNTMPLTFIPALLMGFITQHAGMTWGIFLVNTYSVLVYGLSLIPIYQLQYVVILLYHLSASYIIGMIFAFLASVYGMKTMPMLQAIQMLIGGMGAAVFPIWYKRFVITLDSIRVANFVIFIIGLLNYSMAVFMWLYPPRRKLSPEEMGILNKGTGADARMRLSVAAHMGGITAVNRNSVTMIENEIRKANMIER